MYYTFNKTIDTIYNNSFYIDEIYFHKYDKYKLISIYSVSLFNNEVNIKCSFKRDPYEIPSKTEQIIIVKTPGLENLDQFIEFKYLVKLELYDVCYFCAYNLNENDHDEFKYNTIIVSKRKNCHKFHTYVINAPEQAKIRKHTKKYLKYFSFYDNLFNKNENYSGDIEIIKEILRYYKILFKTLKKYDLFEYIKNNDGYYHYYIISNLARLNLPKNIEKEDVIDLLSLTLFPIKLLPRDRTIDLYFKYIYCKKHHCLEYNPEFSMCKNFIRNINMLRLMYWINYDSWWLPFPSYNYAYMVNGFYLLPWSGFPQHIIEEIINTNDDNYWSYTFFKYYLKMLNTHNIEGRSL